MAVSGQLMNRNNYRIVLEEILKGDNIPRQSVPLDIDNMMPVEKVRI